MGRLPPVIEIGLRVAGALAALVLLFWLIGLLLPHGYETSAEVLIEAPPEQVFPLLNRLDKWPLWSQWETGKDSLFKVEYGPQVEGVGAVQSWTEPRGSGKLWITASEANRSLAYVVEFGDFPRMESRFDLTPEGTGTRVRWSSAGQLPGGAFYGWLRMAFVNGMRDQYQQALGKLAAVVTGKEQSSSAPAEKLPDENQIPSPPALPSESGPQGN